MKRQHILLAIAILIGTVSVAPIARSMGVRLPNCFRVLQMQKQVSNLALFVQPGSLHHAYVLHGAAVSGE